MVSNIRGYTGSELEDIIRGCKTAQDLFYLKIYTQTYPDSYSEGLKKWLDKRVEIRMEFL